MKKLILFCSFGLLGTLALASNEAIDKSESSVTQSCQEMMYEVFDAVEGSGSYSSYELANIEEWLLSFC